ncbi:hypothetical protein KGQ20_18935 [Catenulispora sp. NF23]|uniref:Uncharacterized protein n=1 Tax=Catenulispora pinistramenti TaxID=2705254 RepID=A0ABS5KRC6_9ACTN|nr:hypothetical protein [Catenulispora pinistramenti]MBS2534849.1 hypothetical protein [Catenulispora pinistramenti]MBS2548608.1 hypothetical protein [Catenulispora pinistramenti]
MNDGLHGSDDFDGHGFDGHDFDGPGFDGHDFDRHHFHGPGFDRLSSRLTDLADAPAPPSPFDPARVAAVGRRRVLAARASAVGGSGALAVAAVFGIAAAFAPTAPSAISAAAAARSGIGADPLATVAHFGWLPDSLPNVSYEAAVNGHDSDVTAQGNKSPEGAPRVDLQPLPGDGPGAPNIHERMIPATLDDGRKAYWVTQSGNQGQFAGFFQLRFPAQGGRWFMLTWDVNWNQSAAAVSKISGVPVDPAASGDSAPPASVPVSVQWQATLLRIATQVTDTPAQVPMPFTVAGLPADLQPDQAFLWRPGGFGDGAPGTWSAILVFDRDGGPVDIEVGPHGSVSRTKDDKCKTSAGLDACVEAPGNAGGLNEVGGPKGLLKLLTLIGPDEKQWTTDVIVP